MNVHEVLLHGAWDSGTKGQYGGQATLPGVCSPESSLRYSMTLPSGGWTHATLHAYGAFAGSTIALNQTNVATLDCGMVPIDLLLGPANLSPGGAFVIELTQNGSSSGSAHGVPVSLMRMRLHGPARLVRVLPFYDSKRHRLTARFYAERLGKCPPELSVTAEVLGPNGRMINSRVASVKQTPGNAVILLDDQVVLPWSPETPNLYTLRATLRAGPAVLDRLDMNWAPRSLDIRNGAFVLNNQPRPLVFHVPMADFPGPRTSPELLTHWYESVAKDAKAKGAVISLPLELQSPVLLSLCDRLGIIVQLEWKSAFGSPISFADMRPTWHAWLDFAHRHPSVCLINPWPGIREEHRSNAASALAELSGEFPPMAHAKRDTANAPHSDSEYVISAKEA